MLQADLDERSWMQIHTFQAFASSWTELMHNKLSEQLANASIEYMKPMMHARNYFTGALENSLRSETEHNGDGFDINFFGLFYGNYMDTGNFPAEQQMWAPRGNVQQAFPIDQRFGANILSPYIHGMGYRTPDAPTHFSEKTVEWLANGTAEEIGMLYMNEFIERMVTA